jgi:hypothetical protein
MGRKKTIYKKGTGLKFSTSDAGETLRNCVEDSRKKGV